MRGYAICTTPRSGSNFLGQLLESTGKLGRPKEYFNWPARRRLDDPGYPDKPADQIARIVSDGATANGLYALKAFPDQWRAASAHVPLIDSLPKLKFVRLTRNDVLAQAISWSIAVQTQQYRSTQPAMAAARYDGKLIFSLMQSLILLEADWTQFFARTGLAVLHLTYEDVERDPAQAVERVADWVELGEPVRLDPGAVDLRIQRNQQNEDWRERFRAEHGAADRLYPPTFGPMATT